MGKVNKKKATPVEPISFTNQTSVKNYLKDRDIRVSGEFLESVNVNMAATLSRAAERAVENGRKTVKPADL